MFPYWNHLSELPTPFIFGFAMTQIQVDAMARHILSEEEIAAAGTTHRAIGHKMEEEEATTALVPFWENKVQYYCYVAGVVPSFNGKNPKATIATSLIQEFFDTYGRGPNGEFEKMRSICMPWPKIYACTFLCKLHGRRALMRVRVVPDWLYPMMFDATRILLKKRAPKAGAEADSDAGMSLTPSTFSIC